MSVAYVDGRFSHGYAPTVIPSPAPVSGWAVIEYDAILQSGTEMVIPAPLRLPIIDGRLCDVDGTPGPVEMQATDDPALFQDGARAKVTVQLSGSSPVVFHVALPTGETVLLHTVAPGGPGDGRSVFVAGVTPTGDAGLAQTFQDTGSQFRTALDNTYVERTEVGSTVETPAGAQAKADAAETEAKTYAGTLAYGTNLEATDAVVAGFVDDPGSQTGATLRDEFVRKGEIVINVKDYGAIGDSVTDDTAAIQAALDAASAVVEVDGRAMQRPTVLFPAGVFRITAPFTAITERGLRIVGQGKMNTQISYDSATDSPIFDIGTFSAAPADIYGGGAQDIEIRGIRIRATTPGAIGSRHAQAIRNSGGGGMILDDVSVLGFAYGINSPYGGDFNLFRNAEAEYCDVGVYVGPGGQQFYADRLNCFCCVEGLVLDRFGQAHLTLPNFNNCGEAGMVLEGVTWTSTRQLASFSTSSTSMQSKLVLDSPWFESNAGGMGDDYTTTHFVKANIATEVGDAYRDIVINDAKIVAGATATKTPTSFVGSVGTLVNGLQRVEVNRPVLSGDMAQWFTNPHSSWVLRDRRVEFGYADPPFSAVIGSAFGVVIDGPMAEANVERINVPDLPFTQYWEQGDGGNGIAQKADISGIMAFSFMLSGTWYQRMGLDIQNRGLILDDPSSLATATQITRHASMPTSGSYGSGTFVLNTSPTVSAGKVLLGWLRLTDGDAHVDGTDWTPLYCTTT